MHSQTLHTLPSDIYSVCECMVTVYSCVSSWGEAFNPHYSSMWIFSLFCHFSSIPSPIACDHYIPELCITEYWLHKQSSSGTQKFIELWTDQKQTGDSALVQSKGTKMICINSIRMDFSLHIAWCSEKYMLSFICFARTEYISSKTYQRYYEKKV